MNTWVPTAAKWKIVRWMYGTVETLQLKPFLCTFFLCSRIVLSCTAPMTLDFDLPMVVRTYIINQLWLMMPKVPSPRQIYIYCRWKRQLVSLWSRWDTSTVGISRYIVDTFYAISGRCALCHTSGTLSAHNQSFLEQLHRHNFVHGDIRAYNMVLQYDTDRPKSNHSAMDDRITTTNNICDGWLIWLWFWSSTRHGLLSRGL